MTQKIEFKVGLFLTIATLLILTAIGYVAYKKGLFSKDYTYTLASTTGENLTEGMPVVFWGFKIGRVTDMHLTEKGVLIRIKVPEEHNRVIRTDSRFLLDRPLIGSPRIIVATGNLNGPPLSPDDLPELAVSNDINELIKQVQPIAAKVDQIAANVAAVTANLADPDGSMNRILKEAETITGRLAQKESLLEMMVGEPESSRAVQESLQRIRDITRRADGILAKVDGMADQGQTIVRRADGILAKIDGMSGKGDQALFGTEGILPLIRTILRELLGKLAKLDTILNNADRLSGEAAETAQNLPALRRDLEELLMDVGALIEELDRKIPFKADPEITLP